MIYENKDSYPIVIVHLLFFFHDFSLELIAMLEEFVPCYEIVPLKLLVLK